jgi:16S rRNA A1518/A1519 N6-dimethyltransferase RsmA/KsgA/DIM1 with predicted DNA glycosylase/AP lyase activity
VELFDMVMTYAGQPVRTALEIGAGTGKATRLFAQRGVTVTATEPDGAMLAELLKHVPANVKTVQAAFEDLRPSESYGLVYAAACPARKQDLAGDLQVFGVRRRVCIR